jgi:predicted transposase YdaD
MSKRFDATVKGLLDRGPSDWPALAGFPGRHTDVIDADVSTVTAASDKVLRVRDTPYWLMDVNFQTGPDGSLPRRVHLYNALLEDRHELLVRSVVVLLSKRANLATINGVYSRGFANEEPHLVFRYQVIRVWELPVKPLLEGGLGTLPLAPISDVSRSDLPRVIERMKGRLRARGTLAKELWVATYVLMGLCYEQEFVNHLLRGVITMEESTTYQAIIEEGKMQGRQEGAVEEARKMLVLIGAQHLGVPSRSAKAAIDRLDRVEKVEELGGRVLQVLSWEELLGLPQTRRRR